MPVVVGWPESSPSIIKRYSSKGQMRIKGIVWGWLWNGSAAEVEGFDRASLGAADHDGCGSRIGHKLQVPFSCGEAKSLVKDWHETLLVLVVGRL